MAVKSAARVIDVLDLLKDYPEGLSLHELSNQLEIPKSSMHELLYTMTERNYLIQTETKKFTLGFRLIELGLASLNRVDVYQIAKKHMAKLVNLVEETVFIAVCVEDEIVYVNQMDCSRSIRTNVVLGCHKPIHCTALGKNFLAHMAPQEVEKVVKNKGLPAHTNKTITDYNILLDELAQVRANGIAYDNQEIEEGLSCIACPVFNFNGKVIAAMSVAGPTERIEPRRQEISTLLQEYSLKISNELGYRGSH